MVAIAKTIAKGYDKDNWAGVKMPPVGKYHVVIVRAEEPDSKNKSIVEYMVLAGTVKGQEKQIAEDQYFPLNEKAAKRFIHLLVITGAATEKQIRDGDDIPCSMLVGKQLLISVVKQEAREADGKSYPARLQVDYRGIAAVNDPDWNDVPKNKDWLSGKLSIADLNLDGDELGDGDVPIDDFGYGGGGPSNNDAPAAPPTPEPEDDPFN